MKNSDFNYELQYRIYHNDSVESQNMDNKHFGKILKNHNVLHKNKNAKILEIGCGMGRFMLLLKQLGYKNLFGIDIDKNLYELAKKQKLNVMLSDAIEYLETTNHVFDVIYCLDVVEHIEKKNLLHFFKLLNKHLSKTGFIVVQVPNALSPTGVYNRYNDFTHNLLFTDNSINFITKNAGFKYVVNRAECKEQYKIRRIKSLWARLYKRDWGLRKPILTTNIVSILFNDKKAYEEYLEKAPVIKNRYWRI